MDRTPQEPGRYDDYHDSLGSTGLRPIPPHYYRDPAHGPVINLLIIVVTMVVGGGRLLAWTLLVGYKCPNCNRFNAPLTG